MDRKLLEAYPSKTNRDLRNVWQTVIESTAPDYQKNAILYYILKDRRQLNNAEEHFARAKYGCQTNTGC